MPAQARVFIVMSHFCCRSSIGSFTCSSAFGRFCMSPCGPFACMPSCPAACLLAGRAFPLAHLSRLFPPWPGRSLGARSHLIWAVTLDGGAPPAHPRSPALQPVRLACPLGHPTHLSAEPTLLSARQSARLPACKLFCPLPACLRLRLCKFLLPFARLLACLLCAPFIPPRLLAGRADHLCRPDAI